ncbi:MAG: PKD domain-containing protein [Candidatus Peribacteraceae bacterium]|nr:PKD domain-containing protein [Candidatus Peribacteraceae bacterium]
MPDTPLPPSVDSIAAPASSSPVSDVSGKPAEHHKTPRARSGLRVVLLFLFGFPYLVYVGWSAFLLVVLPDPSGVRDTLIPTAVLVAIVVAVVFVLAGFFGVSRITKAKDIPDPRKRLALLRLVLAVLPGLAISVAVPLLISREPALALQITEPVSVAEFIAPLSVSFSLQDAVGILQKRGLTAEKFIWDFEGDGKVNMETYDPMASASFDNTGTYAVSVKIMLKGGGSRTLTRRITIAKAVFSVDPNPPILDEPVRLSVAHLVTKPEDVEEVLWDFDGDGAVDLSSKELEIVRTFYVEGPVKVTAVMKLVNKSQPRYERTIEVIKTVPLPFPVTVTSDPEHLIGPPPFGVVFRVETEEPARVILWNFGDGSDARGAEGKHTFSKVGVFPVTAEVRAESGKVAKITKIVRIVQALSLSDLTFAGSPSVQGNRIKGEVPVIVDLKPHTQTPLIDFFWEAPGATSSDVTEESVRAVYRREGLYTLTLVAQDPENHVLRLPIAVEVLPPSAKVQIRMEPEGGVAPLDVRFDASETVVPNETISGFEWQFGDADRSAAQQRGAQVTHTYRRPGTYEVKVRVYTTSGKDYSASKTIVVRAPVIDACISASRTEGKAPLGVRFSSECSTVGTDTKYEWDFGDTWKSDLKNPTHDFQKPGTYQVILMLRDGESFSPSDPLTITVQP